MKRVTYQLPVYAVVEVEAEDMLDAHKKLVEVKRAIREAGEVRPEHVSGVYLDDETPAARVIEIHDTEDD